MPLIRILIIIAIIWLLLHLFRQYRERQVTHRANNHGQNKISAPMVKCAHCDLHIPEAEAIKSDDRYYCSQQHRQADPQDS